MNEPSPADPKTQPCVVCREPIKVGARKCIHCNSPQGFTRHLGMSSTVLALLIALISVLQSALPVLITTIEGKHTNLRLNLLSAENTTAVFLATNSGNMPGRLGKVIVWKTREQPQPTNIRAAPLPEGVILHEAQRVEDVQVPDIKLPKFRLEYSRDEGLIGPGEMR